MKTIGLTWGFSLCKLKIPAVLLENGKTGFTSVSSSCYSTSPMSTRINRHTDAAHTFHSSDSSSKDNRPRIILATKSAVPIARTKRKSKKDLELAIVVSPLELASQYSSTVGVSHARTRIFVYLVSVALSLAALSILKLHKLLEWLLVDADVTKFKLSDIHSRSVLIAEIVKAAALRFAKVEDLSPTASTSPSHPFSAPTSPFHSAAAADLSLDVEGPTKFLPHTHSTAFPTNKKMAAPENKNKWKCNFCFHLAAAGSDPCLLCVLATDSLDNLENIIKKACAMKPRDLRCNCQSETCPLNLNQSSRWTSMNNSRYGWAPPSRLNAGISRAQIGTLPSSLSHLSGLNLAAAVGKKDAQLEPRPQQTETSSDGAVSPQHSENKASSENGFNVGSPSLFHRSSKQVACVAPTSHSSSPILRHEKAECNAPSRVFAATAPMQIFHDGSLYLAALQEEHEEDLVEYSQSRKEYASEQARQALTSLGNLTFARAFPASILPKVLQSRSCSPVTYGYRDAAVSPIEDQAGISNGTSNEDEDVRSDSGEFELDVDGIWLTRDNGEMFEDGDDDNDELIQIFDVSWTDQVSDKEETFRTFSNHQKSSYQENRSLRAINRENDVELTNGGQLSDLVTLTTSISDDLMQLKTGYRELLNRVNVNCQELGQANDRLGFVWNTKDNYQRRNTFECDEGVNIDAIDAMRWEEVNDRNPPVSSLITSPALMEESTTSPVLTRRQTPLGRSFISESGEILQKSGNACCSCNCHHYHFEKSQDESFYEEDETTRFVAKWKVNLMDRLPPSPNADSFIPPDLAFEDDDAVQWSNAKPIRCSHRSHFRPENTASS